MDGKIIKGQFIWRTGEDRQKTVDSIKEKINSGYFSSRNVTDQVVEKLWPHFTSVLEN